MKKIKIKITKKMQDELNIVRVICGFKEEPIKENEYLECLFG